MKFEKVNIEVSGNFDAVIEVGSGTISINAIGAIRDIELNGNLRYNMSGKVNSIGSLSIDYNMSGKVSSIGSISIEYNMSGKVSSIGKISIGYNMSGKVSSIGSTTIDYNMSGKISSGSRVLVYNDITFALKGGY